MASHIYKNGMDYDYNSYVGHVTTKQDQNTSKFIIMKFLVHILNILRFDLVLSKVVRKAKWGGTYLPNTMDKNNYFSFLLYIINY